MSKVDTLKEASFGKPIAEDESRELGNYFVQTSIWQKIFNGSTDIIYGPKGSGKSAIFTNIIGNEDPLFDRRILLAVAENPRGAPVFQNLKADPPTSEIEFERFWKLYFLILYSQNVNDYGINNEHSQKLIGALKSADLIPDSSNILSILLKTVAYLKLSRIEGVEGGVEIDPFTGLAKGFKGKIIFAEPTQEQKRNAFFSLDNLLDLLDRSLREAKYSMWILIDRLDVAFDDTPELERNALRALFKVYLDLKKYDSMRLKIFLRDDIWANITKGGFREASHIIDFVSIGWDRQNILDLIIKRIFNNKGILNEYDISADKILSHNDRLEVFHKIFPKQIDLGEKRPNSFEWIISRISDGQKIFSPREIVQLLNFARDNELEKIEQGDSELDQDKLISRSSFKDAVPKVSKVRMEQTIFAERPDYKDCIMKLVNEKSGQTIRSLQKIWELSPGESRAWAEKLSEIGIFEKKGDKGNIKYWIPFMYRDYLKIVQGDAV